MKEQNQRTVFYAVWFVDEETRIGEAPLLCNSDVSEDQTDYSAGQDMSLFYCREIIIASRTSPRTNNDNPTGPGIEPGTTDQIFTP